MIAPEQLARSNSEHGHQSAFFCWAQQSGIPELKWMFAICNGFFSSSGQKGKMKAEGLKDGVWDIYLPIVLTGFGDTLAYAGLWIEMKHERYRNRQDGGLTLKQIEFRIDNQNNYQFAVCYSWGEARDAVLRYLGRL